MDDFEVSIGESPPDVVRIRVKGEIDMATAPELSTAVTKHLSADRPVVLDLSDVTFLDSSGLRALLVAHAEATEAGTRLLIAMSVAVARTVSLTGTDTVLSTYPDAESALGALASQ